jgi:hypothetical protein
MVGVAAVLAQGIHYLARLHLDGIGRLVPADLLCKWRWRPQVGQEKGINYRGKPVWWADPRRLVRQVKEFSGLADGAAPAATLRGWSNEVNGASSLLSGKKNGKV